jgi:predicted AlkP superfamily phosphohydrolase/phosphomutase
MRNIKAWVQSYLNSSDFDWSKTQAFCRGKEGNIFINLKGREPKGIVNPGSEYESARDRIIERLKELIDPKTGQGVVDCIYRREELYKGPMLDWAPDLIVYWKNGAYMPTENDREMDSIFVTRWREYMDWPTTGGHNNNGILVVAGPTIKSNQEIRGANIVDLLPTWLKSLGQKIPPDLEGKILEDIFESAHLTATAK